MMRLLLIFALLAACSSCDERGTSVAAYKNMDDQFKAVTGGVFGSPCTNKIVRDGSTTYEGVPADQCYKFDRPTRFRGLWNSEFEGSTFCPAPADECDPAKLRRAGGGIWLNAERADLGDAKIADDRLYRVEFVGRQASVAGTYGHGGMSDQQIIMDRLISIEEVKPE